MKVLHIFRNLKFGGCQTLAYTLIKKSPSISHYVVYLQNATGDEDMIEEFDSECKGVYYTKQDSGVLHVNNEINKIISDREISSVISWFFPYTLRLNFPGNIKVVNHLGTSTYGDSFLRFLKNTMVLWKYKKNLSSQLLVAPSLHVVNSFHDKYWISKDKIHIIPNFVDSNMFNSSSAGEKKNVAVMVGRMDGSKDFEKFIRVGNSYTGKIRFLAIGDGPNRAELESMNSKFGGAVRFIGSTRNVPEILNESKYSIFLNKEIEGFGNVLLESLSSGCITIASNIGASKEIIEHDKDGFLVNTVNDVLDIISKLETNPSQMEIIRKNALAKIHGPLSADNSVGDYLELLK